LQDRQGWCGKVDICSEKPCKPIVGESSGGLIGSHNCPDSGKCHMRDIDKTKEQLITELAGLRRLVTELEASKANHQQVEGRIEHLNLALRAIRAVDQIVTREKDQGRLLKGVCDNLVETRGYYNAWVALVDKAGRLVMAAEAGLGGDFLPMVEKLKRGELTSCGRGALSQSGIVVIEDPPSSCGDCPLSDKYRGRAAVTARLEHEGKVYGLLSLSLPGRLAADQEEQILLEELIGDIAFALHSIEVQEKRRKAEEETEIHRARFKSIFDHSLEGIVTLDTNNTILDANLGFESIFGWEAEEIEGKWLDGLIVPERFMDGEAKELDNMALDGIVDYETIRKRKDGTEINVSLSAGPVNIGGEVRGRFVIYRDIAERKRLDEALRESEEFSSGLLNSSPNAILVINPDTSIRYVNPALEELTGFASTELSGRKAPYPWWTEETLHRTRRDFRRAMSEGVRRVEELFQKKDGERFWVEIKTTPVRHRGKLKYYLSNWVDITERRKAEEIIKASLKEKEVLLQEVHHRVKNNLQVISSLLKLQSRKIGDEHYAEMLNESQNRVKTMALIHEELYQAEDLARIDLGGYIKSLMRGLFIAYGPEAGRIAPRIEVEDIRLGVNYAMPCGLVINELVSNSLKHAFPDGKKGEIKIAMLRIEGDEVELVVSDNGIGIPESLEFGNPESLGLRLVTMLVEDQLGGQVELDRTEGTRFQIRFGVVE